MISDEKNDSDEEIKTCKYQSNENEFYNKWVRTKNKLVKEDGIYLNVYNKYVLPSKIEGKEFISKNCNESLINEIFSEIEKEKHACNSNIIDNFNSPELIENVGFLEKNDSERSCSDEKEKTDDVREDILRIINSIFSTGSYLLENTGDFYIADNNLPDNSYLLENFDIKNTYIDNSKLLYDEEGYLLPNNQNENNFRAATNCTLLSSHYSEPFGSPVDIHQESPNSLEDLISKLKFSFINSEYKVPRKQIPNKNLSDINLRWENNKSKNISSKDKLTHINPEIDNNIKPKNKLVKINYDDFKCKLNDPNIIKLDFKIKEFFSRDLWRNTCDSKHIDMMYFDDSFEEIDTGLPEFKELGNLGKIFFKNFKPDFSSADLVFSMEKIYRDKVDENFIITMEIAKV